MLRAMNDIVMDSFKASFTYAFKLNNNDYYPIVSLHLRIFTTHTIASTSAERSFTAVKYLESCFRNIMTEFRLNGLAVMCTFLLIFPLILTC
ncbi:hypothetical protein T09_5201 [Trichinella sp. T9]|nr:hypothetical protein T09_5201 [Trichinella sp. T9]